MYISVNDIEKSTDRFRVIAGADTRQVEEMSEEAYITEVPAEAATSNVLSPQENLEKRKEMLKEIHQEPLDFALERAIGKNDSVYSNFVELISSAKEKVGRIAVKDGSKNKGYATGFMVSARLLLTNWHVFETKESVGDSEVQFFYELNTKGNLGDYVSFKLNANEFYTSNKELDYCLIAVDELAIDGKFSLTRIGYLYLDPNLGKIGNEREEALNIIHHPDGDYKQLSIRENLFVKITPSSIWYESDTAPGSSGSPVFNDQWQVVALHHMGVAKRNINGEYVDKDDNPIPRINGKIDASKVVWIANEGIRTSVILKHLFEIYADNPLAAGIKIAPDKPTSVPQPKPNPIDSREIDKPNNIMENNSSNDIKVFLPASLVDKTGSIQVTISQSSVLQTKDKSTHGTDNLDDELDFAEVKKLESELNLSHCKGYLPNFLGVEVALPQPSKAMKKYIAKVNNGGNELKYYHYSVIFHSVRMQPLISAINVDGDLKKRQDASKRKDSWLRDYRISYDIQLGDEYYKRSGFDRGHMSRREDANWGTSAEEAKRNADLTCMYSNACPQVAGLNQSSRNGLWGMLEKIVLETGASAQKGREAKISVFNGPVFKDSDPVYKGIQVPLEFYKVVLWINDNGDLKATAFVLSQEDLVEEIDFEAIDIDQAGEFVEYQVSLKKLASDTGLDFSELYQYDTFIGNNNENEIKISNESHVREHIKSNR